MTKRPDQTFPKTLRVVKGDDFTRVLRRGGCAANGTIVVFVLPQKEPQTAPESPSPDSVNDSTNESAKDLVAVRPTRLGITIPKKVGNAVIRNQWKRHVREAFRTQKGRLPAGYDIVVRPKKDAPLDPSEIHRGLTKLVAKAIARTRPQN